jgi:hypothetical protein
MTPLRQFAIGDKVLLYDVTTKVGYSRKLTKRWKGPYTIIEQNSDVTYTIADEKGTQLVTLHRLKAAGDEEKNNYLEHQDDLNMAEVELTSINDTIQHLLTMKADKEKEKLLLDNAIIHDNSVVDENGKVMQEEIIENEIDSEIDDIEDEEENENENENEMISSSSSSSSTHHVNSMTVMTNRTLTTQHTRAFWL